MKEVLVVYEEKEEVEGISTGVHATSKFILYVRFCCSFIEQATSFIIFPFHITISTRIFSFGRTRGVLIKFTVMQSKLMYHVPGQFYRSEPASLVRQALRGFRPRVLESS